MIIIIVDFGLPIKLLEFFKLSTYSTYGRRQIGVLR